MKWLTVHRASVSRRLYSTLVLVGALNSQMLRWIICCIFALAGNDGACITSTFLLVKLQTEVRDDDSSHLHATEILLLFTTQDIKHLGQKRVNWTRPMASDLSDMITKAQPVWLCSLPQQQGRRDGGWQSLAWAPVAGLPRWRGALCLTRKVNISLFDHMQQCKCGVMLHWVLDLLLYLPENENKLLSPPL